MDWSTVDALMVATRAVHFAATVITAGSIIFRTVVAPPSLRLQAIAADSFSKQSIWIAWLALAASVVSGAIWLLLQALSMSGMSLDEALATNVFSTVVNDTQFGNVAMLRAVLAVGLAACLALDRMLIVRRIGLAAALAFAASIAWTGHAGSTIGTLGYLHLAADALHLIAAAAWIGGLVALLSFLAVAHQNKAKSLACDAVRRFSTLGIASVAILLLSGIINAAILVGSPRGLVATDYGRVLLLKLGLFAVMLAFAGVNRFRLTPRLSSSDSERQSTALRKITRNSAIEIALGLGILILVGLLGTLHPAIHMNLSPD